MAKKLLKKISVSEELLEKHVLLSKCLAFTQQANVLHFNRRSASRAVLIGTFCAFIPLPVQMILGILCCLWFRANLPITIGIVWLTNPLTMAPIFLATYHFGAFLMGEPTITFDFEMNWRWVETQFLMIWQPLLLGSLTAGVIFSCIGYTLIEISWRHHVLTKWKARQKARKAKREQS